ncbi:putative T6SS immunity periplasmic lipoprotein [Erwinia oleae]|uniref:putative T6SS immunity periplasmic lipoprotein n=1 Tax=Erwinia oleae TaxID=796334 RepID=UPI00054F407C|nr:putative T6SS immunity periplasmic lipoprotein [Erwinia oleae]
MKKFFLLFTSVFFLSGCWFQDSLVFKNPGYVYVYDRFVCIKSSSGDSLNYFMISSPENRHMKPVRFGDNLNRKYPDTCILVVLTPGVEYTMLYILNGVKYRVVFDSNGTINRSP